MRHPEKSGGACVYKSCLQRAHWQATVVEKPCYVVPATMTTGAQATRKRSTVCKISQRNNPCSQMYFCVLVPDRRRRWFVGYFDQGAGWGMWCPWGDRLAWALLLVEEASQAASSGPAAIPFDTATSASASRVATITRAAADVVVRRSAVACSVRIGRRPAAGKAWLLVPFKCQSPAGLPCTCIVPQIQKRAIRVLELDIQSSPCRTCLYLTIIVRHRPCTTDVAALRIEVCQVVDLAGGSDVDTSSIRCVTVSSVSLYNVPVDLVALRLSFSSDEEELDT